MQFDLANVLVFAFLGGGFLFATLFLGSLLRPNTPDPEKLGIYECGEKPIQQAWFNFNPRFYIVALIFLIFDVEVAFTYPVAVVFRRWALEGGGGLAFFELVVFIAILALGLAYVWKKGDLEWIRRLKADKGLTEVAAPPAKPAPTETEAEKKAA
jgi:NADH-quinone oxidoreductase subunit A